MAKKVSRKSPQKRQRKSAESMAEQQKQIAVSEFFAKNRHLLGFDNPTKALLTTVREAVDNALDACEEAGILPAIDVICSEIQEGRYRLTIRDNGPGIVKNQLSKIFAQLLYGSKFHRLKQSRGQQGIGISAAVMYGQMTTGQPARVISKTGPRKSANRVELQIDTKKNKAQIVSESEEKSEEWAEIESGTEISIVLQGNYKGGKHGIDAYLRQTALANPHAEISFVSPKGDRFEYPRVVEELPIEPKEIKPHPHGIELGTLMRMLQDSPKTSISSFLRENFSRVSPTVAQVICEVAGLSTRMSTDKAQRGEVEALYNAIQETKIQSPPTNCLSAIGEESLVKGLYWLFVEAQKHNEEAKAIAEQEAAAQMGLLDGIDDSLETQEGNALDDPTLEEDDGVAKRMERLELNEDGALESEQENFFVTAVSRPPNVYRGNPFRVEVGLFYGKGLPADQQAHVYRFANRVPLQYQTSACAMTKAVISSPWKSYQLQQSRGAIPVGPMVIMTHIASAWVPYTSESKEAIAHYDEILKELRLAIMECGRRLQRFLKKRKRISDEHKKRSYIEKYMNPIADGLQEILGFSEHEKGIVIGKLKGVLEESRADRLK